MVKDAIVVLGCGVRKDGSLTVITQTRVDKGVKLFREEVAKHIVLTGHKEHWLRYTPPKSEARAMKDYALSLGVSKRSIVLEEKARTTLGNAYFTKKDVLEPRDWKNLVVVTSDFHVPRSEYIFRKVLGSSYTLKMVGAKSPITLSGLQEMVSSGEQKIFSFWRKVLAPMPSGADSYAALVIKLGLLLRKVKLRRKDWFNALLGHRFT